MAKELISIANLQSRYCADLEAGKVYRLSDDREIGYIDRVGENSWYARIKIDGKIYYLHRIIWALAHGEWPETIDHIDGNSLNNALSNLRSGSASMNMQNRGAFRNESVLGRGVSIARDKNGKPRYYRSQVTINGEGKLKDFPVSEPKALLSCQLHTYNTYAKAGFPERHYASLETALRANPDYQELSSRIAADEKHIGDMN